MPERDDEDGEDFLHEVRELFDRAHAREDKNHKEFEADIRFAMRGEQWDDAVSKLRADAGRPCLTLNKMPTFIRQVVNDARQNKPSITVHPADSNADPATAEIISGLIRNIEVTSDADVAYDTAITHAVAGGFGYLRINTAYTSDDSFDSDIVVERIADPLTVFPDPDSESADGSDWNHCFIVKVLTKDEFAAKYKNAEKSSWWDEYAILATPWRDDENILVCEYWKRVDVERQIIALSNDTVVGLDEYEEQAESLQMLGIVPVSAPRSIKSKKVTQYILSGAEVLEETEWPGVYIPIVPVYGDEITLKGERTFKSLIRDAKDAQREFNYWRSTASELVALSPKVPFIGRKGAFDTDIEKWNAVNDTSIPFIEFDGPERPSREPYQGPPAAVLQQALTAADDMKAIIGLYDASLGARSNETSGVAINARAREGDVSTFHFIDNLTRAIRQAGRILIDLIPKVYSTARIVRILGQDMKPQNAQIAPQDQQQQVMQAAMMKGQQIARIYDITAGKYDLTVKSGPSFTTAREQARAEIVEMIRSYPPAATVLAPMYLRNSDWPGADEAAAKLEQMGAAQAGQQANPQLAQMQQAMAKMQQDMAQLQQENFQLKLDQQNKAAELQIRNREVDVKAGELQIKLAQANTDAVRASAEMANPYTAAAPNAYRTA